MPDALTPPARQDPATKFWMEQVAREIRKLRKTGDDLPSPDDPPVDNSGQSGSVAPVNIQFIVAEAGDLTDQTYNLAGVIPDSATAVCVFARAKTNDGADIILNVKQNSGASYQTLLEWGFIEANGGQATGCSSTWVALDNLTFMYNLATTGTAVTDAWVVAYA